MTLLLACLIILLSAGGIALGSFGLRKGRRKGLCIACIVVLSLLLTGAAAYAGLTVLFVEAV